MMKRIPALGLKIMKVKIEYMPTGFGLDWVIKIKSHWYSRWHYLTDETKRIMRFEKELAEKIVYRMKYEWY